MIDLVVKTLINAIAVYVAVKIVPMIHFNFGSNWWKLVAVAVILALINTYVKPIAKALSFPITLMTLGLFSFVLNAALLLLVAVLSSSLSLGFKIGTFPPSINSDAIIGALLGSLVISVVSMLLGFVNTGRKIVS